MIELTHKAQKRKNNPTDENDYLSLVREKYSTVKIAANPAKYIDDGHAKPAGHPLHVAHDGKVKDQSAAKMNYPKTEKRIIVAQIRMKKIVMHHISFFP